MDKFSSHRFLLDTGAEVNVLPPSRSERRHCDKGCNLLAFNGSAISTYGKRSLTLDLGLRRTFRWVFVIANIKSPILGADFLRHYSLLVDMKHSHLVDAITQLQVQGLYFQVSFPSPALYHPQSTNTFTTIVTEYPAVFQPHLHSQNVEHDITYHIRTTGPPISAHTRRLAPEKLTVAKHRNLNIY